MKGNTSSTWQQVIWREWRHCTDPEYAQQLFELVADEPAGWLSRLSLMGLNALTGASLGLIIGFVLSSSWSILSQFILAGGIIGGVAGYLAGRQLTWRRWLQRLAANTPTSDWPRFIGNSLLLGGVGGLIFGPMFWLSVAGLFWGIGGMIPWLNRGSSRTDPGHPEERRWWFWWRIRPWLLEVEAALQEASRHHPLWNTLLARLRERRAQKLPPEALVQGLLSPDWQERFITTYALINQGDQASMILQMIIRKEETPLRQTIEWLLLNVEQPAQRVRSQPSRGDSPT